MNACLTKQVQVATTAAKNAAKACKAEQLDPNFAAGHGNKSFADYYGTSVPGCDGSGNCEVKGSNEKYSAAQKALSAACE